MPSALCLARMELNGVGFSNAESERLKNILQAKLRTLEEEAYRLANHSFSLTSREDVAQVWRSWKRKPTFSLLIVYSSF